MPSKTEQRKQRLAIRDVSIYNAYKNLHSRERIRYDDCIKRIASQYFLAESTIEKILHRQRKLEDSSP